MIVDPDFFEHWRTRMLVDSLGGDQMAPMYVMRIWAHCQVRKATRFDTMSSAGLKALCRYAGDAAALESALIDADFLARDGSAVDVLKWADHNAKLISNWKNGATGGRPKITESKPTENPNGAMRTHSEPIGLDKIREDKKREEKKVLKSKTESATPSALPDWLPADCWAAFVEMRKAIKKPLTPGGIPLAMQKLDTLRAAGNDPRAVLEQSTLNSWQGLFEIKPQYAKQGAQSQKFNFANADRSGDQLAQAESMARHGITSIPDGDIEI